MDKDNEKKLPEEKKNNIHISVIDFWKETCYASYIRSRNFDLREVIRQ